MGTAAPEGSSSSVEVIVHVETSPEDTAESKKSSDPVEGISISEEIVTTSDMESQVEKNNGSQ